MPKYPKVTSKIMKYDSPSGWATEKQIKYWKSMKKSQIGKGNHNWTGDNIKSYVALHQWVGRHKNKPEFCELCRKKENVYGTSKLVLANISGEYKRDLNDWIYCHQSCHILEHKKGNHKNFKFKDYYKVKISSVEYKKYGKKYKKRPEQIEKNKIYRKISNEKRRLYNLNWRINNREKSRKYHREYYKKNYAKSNNEVIE